MNRMRSPEQHTIAPELFRYVSEYVNDIKSGRAQISKSVRGDNRLVIFCENLLAQFSANYLGRSITGFNRRTLAQLKAARGSLSQGSPNTRAAQLLVFHLEQLCSKVPEMTYGHSEADAEEFHLEYFPELLTLLVDWLEDHEARSATTHAAEYARSAYLQAIDELA